jgi:hypothetical protein
LLEMKHRSTRHSDLFQRIQDSVERSQEAYRPSYLSKTAKVDMSVIEKIKALRRRSPEELGDLEGQREATIRRIQERHAVTSENLEPGPPQKPFSMADRVEEYDGEVQIE